MRRDAIKLVSERSACQRNKYSNLAPAGLLQPLNLSEHIWEELAVDFIDGLPKYEGYSVIMVVVDRLSKSAHFIPLKHPYTATSVAVEFIRGHPTEAKYRLWPQTDGQTKVVNCSLETCLRCFSSSKPKQWVKWLPWAEYWYNTSFHSSIGITPFKVLYGRDPPTIMGYGKGVATTFEVDRYLLERDEGVFKTSFAVLWAFEIVERVGAMAYRLKLPPKVVIHPVLHVSQLKARGEEQFGYSAGVREVSWGRCTIEGLWAGKWVRVFVRLGSGPCGYLGLWLIKEFSRILHSSFQGCWSLFQQVVSRAKFRTWVEARSTCLEGFLLIISRQQGYVFLVVSFQDSKPIPPAPIAPAGQQVAPEILAAHAAWVKGSKEIAGLILMSMEPEIQ
nr:Ty3/gypsy retrotransposon protein [Tanacetum cinerariifolium]